MFEALAQENDPRLQELQGLVSAIAANQRMIAKLQALEIEHLARANALALELSEDSEYVADLAQSKRQEVIVQTVQTEIAASTRVSDRTVARHMSDAWGITHDYPELFRALRRGSISKAHAVTIADAGCIISSPSKKRAYEQEMLDYAKKSSVNRVRHVARQIAEQYTDHDIETRAAQAHAQRCLKLQPLEDGLSQLTAIIPSTQGAALYDRLSRMARLVKRHNNRARAQLKNIGSDNEQSECAQSSPELQAAASDARTVMQIRTDLFLDIALTGFPSAINCTADDNEVCATAKTASDDAPGVTGTLLADTTASSDNVVRVTASEATPLDATLSATFALTNEMLGKISAHVQVVIPVLSLLPDEQLETLKAIPEFTRLERLSGFNGAPQLTGHGPIPREIARLLLGTASSWDRLLTDPISGLVITADQYTPTASVRRAVVARDLHCRFPGCRVPARQCEADHTLDWALGGKTVPENLGHLCFRHHTLKHHTDWKVEQLEGGVLKWTSPLGTIVEDEPVSTVIFQAITDDTAERNNSTCAKSQEGEHTTGADPRVAQDDPPPF